jgi:hypothetical protein
MDIHNIIAQATFLDRGEKLFLENYIQGLNSLDQLKLKQEIISQQRPEVLKQYIEKKNTFVEKETPKADPIGDFVAKFIPQKAKTLVHTSWLSQPHKLGAEVPVRQQAQVQPLTEISGYIHPGQLGQLNPHMVAFNLEDNVEQILQEFMQKLDTSMAEMSSQIRRGFLLAYLQSPLYGAYINSGLTGLRHAELQPAVLNTLHQINPQYLPIKSFVVAAKITSHIRQQCGL